MRVRVESYSGYKADERPLSFYLGEHRYVVAEVLDQWGEPDAMYFRVRADDGNLYILRRTGNAVESLWSLEAFRKT